MPVGREAVQQTREVDTSLSRFAYDLLGGLGVNCVCCCVFVFGESWRLGDLASETAWVPGRCVEKEQEVQHGQRVS